MAFVLQAAGNAAGQVSQGESELQLMRRVHNACKYEHALSGSNVDFNKVRSRVLASSQTHAESIPFIYGFVLKFCGGHGAELLLESEAYIRHHSVPNRRLGQSFFQALSLDTKGSVSDMNARVRHALLKLACLPDENVSKSDISRLVQANDKAIQAKVKEADNIMTEMRVHLQQHKVFEQCLDLVHQFDMDAVRLLLGRRIGRKYLSVGGVAHDFLLHVSVVAGVRVPSRLEVEASLTTDFPPPEVSPSSASGSKPTLQMRELDDMAQLSNMDVLLQSRGISVDSHVRRKADGVTGVIKVMTATVATVTVEGGDPIDVPLPDLLSGQWFMVRHKDIPQQMDVSGCIANETFEYKLHVTRANVVIAIDGHIQDHVNSHKALKLLNKPRRVEVLKSFSKGSLVIAPCSTRLVSTQRKVDDVPSAALGLSELMTGVQFWLTQQTTIPTADKHDGFVSAFWFIETTTEKEEVNVELSYIKSTAVVGLRIPVYKNIKALKAGDVLMMLDKSVGQVAEVEIADEPAKRKRKKSA